MRLIDVCIPKFDDDEPLPTAPPPPPDRNASHVFKGLFGQRGIDYSLDDNDEEGPEDSSKSHDELFFESNEGTIDVRDLI